jgi:hypothetical protein
MGEGVPEIVPMEALALVVALGVFATGNEGKKGWWVVGGSGLDMKRSIANL